MRRPDRDTGIGREPRDCNNPRKSGGKRIHTAQTAPMVTTAEATLKVQQAAVIIIIIMTIIIIIIMDDMFR